MIWLGRYYCTIIAQNEEQGSSLEDNGNDSTLPQQNNGENVRILRFYITNNTFCLG